MKDKKVYQSGFTLIEMLVVIAVIALLAALLFPAVDSALRRARQTKCMSNLRGFGIAWNTYYLDVVAGPHASELDAVQPWLSVMMPDYVPEASLFLCPSDRSRGKWGSKPAGVGESALFRGVDTEDFPETNDLPGNATNRNEDVEACSYMYEFCDAEEMIGWWRNFLRSSQGGTASEAEVDLNRNGVVTWAEVKLHQLQFGDLSSGRGYERSAFPLVRCFHHYNDKQIAVKNTTLNITERSFRVINVAVSGNVFLSGLAWEYPLAD